MKTILKGRFLMPAMLLVSGVAAVAASNHPAANLTPDAALFDKVRHAIVMYPRYSIFDDVYVQVADGTVHLTGVVSQPFKKSDLDKIVRQAAAGVAVQDDVRVLPLSPNDERLRQRIARAIYGDVTMTKYALDPVKPIHVIVENGRVTLTGIVATDFDKQIAGTRASSAMTFGPVVNDLHVENPSKKS